MILQDGFLFAFILVSSFRAKSRNLSCASAFLPDSSTGSHVSYAISHSPFPFYYEDPSASLGMTRREMPSRCCRDDRSGGWCLFETLYPLPLARPFSKGLLLYQAKSFYHLSVTLCRSPYRHFERSREIFLAHRLSCRMALLVSTFPTLSHTHHFPSCHKDPSASLGMTRRGISRCITPSPLFLR